MDALRIPRAVIGGFDWGARTADIVAALWPERVKALVPVSGYFIVNLVANQRPLSPQAEHGWWYQYYFATQRGEDGYRENTHDFNRLIWQEASPTWKFDDATYDRSAASFTNPDHVDIVIHNYRWRLSLAPGEPQYDGGEVRYRAKVEKLLVKDDHVTGVRLRDGSEISAPVVVSNLSPDHTLIDLVGAEHLPVDLVTRLSGHDHRASFVQIHFALDGLPEFAPP
jgi:pimeloyl-ACP methyl ester carboxylesterase